MTQFPNTKEYSYTGCMQLIYSLGFENLTYLLCSPDACGYGDKLGLCKKFLRVYVTIFIVQVCEDVCTKICRLDFQINK